MPVRSTFDRQYYARFYGGVRPRRSYFRDEAHLGAFVSAYLDYLGQPVRNVVDIGCGFGQWREILAGHYPKSRYTGVERSDYLCERFGWTQGSAVDFRSRSRFDLVICKDTLQYLARADCEAAIANLARLSRGALYVSVLSSEDWEQVADRDRTDRAVHLRPAAWYRRRLAAHFRNLGGGLWLSPRSPALPWALEALPARSA